jgi:hypothetical protein
MAEQTNFPDLLRDEITQLEDVLSRNPTWIKLQAARRTLAAYEGPEPKKHRAAAQPKCGKCHKPYSAHRVDMFANRILDGTEKRLCPNNSTQTYEPEKKP